MKVRGQDVLLPATLVGAYPRPIYMEGKVFPVGVHEPEYVSYRMRELYHHAVSAAVRDMLGVGLDIVTDGGQYYENETGYEYAGAVHAMAHKLDGYAGYGDRIQVGAFDLPIYKPTVLGDVAWRRPVFKPVVEAVREDNDAPLKVNASLGPATLSALSTDQHYHDLKALSQDVAKAYNAEFKDLARRGVDLIQITEPLTFFEPEDWIISAINTAFEGVDAYKVVHICYGHEEGQPGILDLKADRLFPWAFDLNCDQIHFQMASHEFAEVDSLRGWPPIRIWESVWWTSSCFGWSRRTDRRLAAPAVRVGASRAGVGIDRLRHRVDAAQRRQGQARRDRGGPRSRQGAAHRQLTGAAGQTSMAERSMVGSVMAAGSMAKSRWLRVPARVSDRRPRRCSPPKGQQWRCSMCTAILPTTRPNASPPMAAERWRSRLT